MKSSFEGYSTATILDWIVKNIGKSFRQAHEISGKIVLLAEKQIKLHDLDLDLMQSIEPKITNDIYTFLSPINSINQKNLTEGLHLKELKKHC